MNLTLEHIISYLNIIEKISPQLAAVGVVSTGTVLRSKNGGAH